MPASYRWALVIALVLGFQLALSAAIDLEQATHIENPSLYKEENALAATGLSGEAQRELWLAQRSAYQTAVNGLLPWRYGTSGALALAAAVLFALGLRLAFFAEDRTEAARTLGRAAIVTAVLRSIDGAQDLVITRAVVEATGRALVSVAAKEAEAASQLLSIAGWAGSVGKSVVVVAVLMGLAGYFRSQKLHTALSRAE